MGKINCEILTGIKDLIYGQNKIVKDMKIFTNDDLKLDLPVKTRKDFVELEDKCNDIEFGRKLVCLKSNSHM